MMRLLIDGKSIQAECGMMLSACLSMDMPCGGKGKCGKCKVIAVGKLSPMTEQEKRLLTERELAAGVRLACMTQLLGDAEVFTLGGGDLRVATDGVEVRHALCPSVKKYGLAVDIGTTTLVVGLYSAQGELLAKQGAFNPQIRFGADVVSRIQAALDGKGAELQKAVTDEIERLGVMLCRQSGVSVADVDGAVITGNTAMLYLLTGTPVDGLARMPFSLVRSFDETVTAKTLGMTAFSADMAVYLPPCISPFIGADTACALLATSFWSRTDRFMLADIGTNGEIVLFDKGRMYACSTAAGPAFEGVGISCGMRGEDGAIEHIYMQDGGLCLQTIGNQPPKGICGSGVIDAVACLLEMGAIEETGYMEKNVALSEGVVFTCKDVRAVQLAKGAIYAGLTTLLKTVDISAEAIDSFMTAGGFGGHIHLQNAGKIGLFPKEWVPRTKILGNAAYNGAAALLLDESLRSRCRQAAKDIEVIDLSADAAFAEEYAEAMMF